MCAASAALADAGIELTDILPACSVVSTIAFVSSFTIDFFILGHLCAQDDFHADLNSVFCEQQLGLSAAITLYLSKTRTLLVCPRDGSPWQSTAQLYQVVRAPAAQRVGAMHVSCIMLAVVGKWAPTL